MSNWLRLSREKVAEMKISPFRKALLCLSLAIHENHTLPAFGISLLPARR